MKHKPAIVYNRPVIYDPIKLVQSWRALACHSIDHARLNRLAHQLSLADPNPPPAITVQIRPDPDPLPEPPPKRRVASRRPKDAR